MGSEPAPLDATIDETLRAGDESLRKSGNVLRGLNGMLTAQRGALVAADHSLARARRLLDGVDVDLAALEQRSPRFSGAATRASQPVRVLIVDDSEPIRRVLTMMLTFEFGDDVNIRTVAGGGAAIEAAPWQPALVILDWQMPGMDGLETARRLRPLLPATVIVVYSAQPAPIGAEQAKSAGADAYVEKGSDASGLLAHVAGVVNGRRVTT
jgi:CheY-like chemotaxis protein